MNFLSGSGSGSTFMAPLVFWALVAVTVTVGIGICIAKFTAAGKAKAEAEAVRALNLSLRDVPRSCRANGHVFQEHDTGWQCATCGNYVPRRDGESYGLVADGRHERRRRPR
jgi:hypothetical protein